MSETKKKKKNNPAEGSPETVKTKAESPNTEEDEDPVVPEEPVQETEQQEAQDPAVEELAAAREELQDMKERLLRTAAEFDNFRKRTEKEKAAAMSLGMMAAVEKLLPVLDTLERAASAECGDEEYKKGVEMTVSVFSGALHALGVEEIEAQGAPFDPNVHNAVSREASEQETGTVLHVLQKGYRMGDRVIRHAMVSVAE